MTPLFTTGKEKFLLHLQKSENQKIVIHELLGHGSGRLLTASSPTDGNDFDARNPSISPLTGQKINTWYKSGQTYNSVFGYLAASMEECRAECIAAYIGVMGLNALLFYNVHNIRNFSLR